MEENNMGFLFVPTLLMNDILAYFGSRPHTEADPYIKAIQSSCRLVPKEMILEPETPEVPTAPK